MVQTDKNDNSNVEGPSPLIPHVVHGWEDDSDETTVQQRMTPSIIRIAMMMNMTPKNRVINPHVLNVVKKLGESLNKWTCKNVEETAEQTAECNPDDSGTRKDAHVVNECLNFLIDSCYLAMNAEEIEDWNPDQMMTKMCQVA